MDIFINENCSFNDNVYETDSFGDTISRLNGLLDYILRQSSQYDNLNIYYPEGRMPVWYEKYKEELDQAEAMSEVTLFKKKISDDRITPFNRSNYLPHHYLLLTNATQYFATSLEHDKRDTILADAIEKYNLNTSVAILNMPDSDYSDRDFIPIIKIRNDKEYPILVNLPCFQEIQALNQYLIIHLLLSKSIKNEEKLKEIIQDYEQFEFDWNNWIPNENLFPTNLISSKIDTVSTYKKEAKENPSEKIAIFKKIGGLIARINGYQFNQDLTSYNQKIKKSMRAIYEAGENNNKVYLSIDFENGPFEVCDYQGSHLGEYNYRGELKPKSQDKTGKHDILIP